MAVYFAGSEPDILDSFGGSVVTSGFCVVSGVNRAALSFNGTQFGVGSFAPQTTGWMHFLLEKDTNFLSGGFVDNFLLRNVEGQVLFRVQGITNSTTVRFQVLSQTPYDFAGLNSTIDLSWKLSTGSDGYFRVWRDGINVINYTGVLQFPSGTQSVQNFYARGQSGGGNLANCRFSQFLVSNESTLSAKVYTRALSAGAINNWAGTLTNITGTTLAGSTNALSETTADDTFVCVTEDLPTLGIGENITAVVGSASALVDVGSPVTKLAFAAYDGATTTEFATQATPTTSFAGYKFLANTNFENANIAWTVTDFNALQFGFRAKA